MILGVIDDKIFRRWLPFVELKAVTLPPYGLPVAKSAVKLAERDAWRLQMRIRFPDFDSESHLDVQVLGGCDTID